MQGIETASMANDVCGVPLPWTLTFPWLFFDGKLFHLKLKMSTYVLSLRELCDEDMATVSKVERFRKAILEDVEHFLLPTHNDPFFRGGIGSSAINAAANFMNSAAAYGGGGGGGAKHTIHPMANIPMAMNGYYGGGGGGGGGGNLGRSALNAVAAAAAAAQSMPASNYYGGTVGNNIRGGGSNRGRRGGVNVSTNIHPQLVRQQIGHRQNVCQLKVGGVVVGSWAGGIPPKHIGGSGGIAGNHPLRFSRAAAVVNQRRRGGAIAAVGGHHAMTTALRRQNVGGAVGGGVATNRTIARTAYGVTKINKNRTRKAKTDKKPPVTTAAAVEGSGDKSGDVTEKKNDGNVEETTIAKEKIETDAVVEPIKIAADKSDIA